MPPSRFPVPDFAFPAPDTYYGASKAAWEVLGALYVNLYGLDIVCIEDPSCFVTPQHPRMLATWLSPDDCARLFEACLPPRPPAPGDLRRFR